MVETLALTPALFDVIDVPSKPQAYFEKENSCEQIANIVKMHQEDRIMAE